ALKIYHPELLGDRKIFARIEREAAVLKALDHPSIAKLLDVRALDDGLFMVMEYVEGTSLDYEIRLRSAGEVYFDPLEIARIVDDLADALAHAHDQGIVHRDLKPSNIIVRGRGEDIRATLLDFGVARVMFGEEAPDQTTVGRIIGTRRYMSPEQTLGLL